MRPAEQPRLSELFLIAESEEDRAARVQQIRDSVVSGAYEVPPGDVADSLVAFFRRDFVVSELGNPDVDGNSC